MEAYSYGAHNIKMKRNEMKQTYTANKVQKMKERKMEVSHNKGGGSEWPSRRKSSSASNSTVAHSTLQVPLPPKRHSRPVAHRPHQSQEVRSLSHPMTFISRNISRSQSLDEIRLYSVCKPLHVELSLVSEELQQKCEENEELKRYVHEINHECLELHAEVFEEANKQVQEAMAKQATAEALLQCSAAENARLREQVVQLQHQHHQQQHHGLTKSQKNKRRRSVAVMMSELLELVSPSPHSPLVHSTRPQQHGLKKHPDLCPDELSSLDSGEYHEFVQWLQAGAPVMSPAAALELRGKSPLVCPFLVTVTLEDIVPCIRFHHTALTQRLLRAFPSMHFSMQSSLTDEPCPLVLHQTCDFQLVFLEDSEDHSGDAPSDDGRNAVNISKFAKNRIDAVCAFFCFVNSLCEDAASLALPERQQELFAHIQYLRRAMCLARLGFPVANWDADQDEEADEVFALHRSNAAERQRITV